MFKILSFRSDGAFWPLSERSDFEAGRGAPGTLLGKAMALARRFRAEHTARRAMRELEGLDDRTLQDIGISRDQIWHAVRHGRGAASGGGFDLARWS
jgi:uncharacterized protein YjiS (DUF1127 family)